MRANVKGKVSKPLVAALKILSREPEAPEPAKRASTACGISMEFDDDKLPETFTDILYAWRKIGNPWISPLEASLKISSKGLNFENSIDNTQAVRVLVYLGYMLYQEYTRAGTVCRSHLYKLSDKGIRVAKEIAERIGDNVEEVSGQSGSSEEETECSTCEGSGIDGEGDTCKSCRGTGTIRVRKSSSNESNGVRRTNGKTVPVSAPIQATFCANCGGSGSGEKNGVCRVCNGTGEKQSEPIVKKLTAKIVKRK